MEFLIDDIEVKDPFDDVYRDSYLEALYLGGITKDNLSHDYHYSVATKLMAGVVHGFDGGVWPPFSVEEITLSDIQQNIYRFSAAKQYQQVRDLSKLIKELGEGSSFPEFRKKAELIFDEYNLNYLRTEYRTAVAQAQSAKQWLKFTADKEVLPMLEYRSQNDPVVRPEHQDIHGTIRPVNHPFWSTYMPPNGWNCRCFVVQHPADVAATPEVTVDPEEYPEIFKMNAGKDKMVFNPKKHPYFTVARGDADLRANNFNLPLP